MYSLITNSESVLMFPSSARYFERRNVGLYPWTGDGYTCLIQWHWNNARNNEDSGDKGGGKRVLHGANRVWVIDDE